MNTIQKKQSLLEALESFYPDSSKRTLKNWIKGKKVSLNGKVITKANLEVKKGEKLLVGKRPRSLVHGVKILYEDAHLVIIHKEVGLLSVPLDKPGSRNVLDILRRYYNSSSIFAIHRIDRGTSGVLAFAKSYEAREGMDELFKNHDLIREYLAIVEGKIEPSEGEWKSRLVEKTAFEVCSTESKSVGKEAITYYEVSDYRTDATVLRLRLETGRKHQIRVHCRDAGHPIIGDERYGSKKNPHRRLCLHAHRLAFTHPITGKEVDVIADAIGF